MKKILLTFFGILFTMLGVVNLKPVFVSAVATNPDLEWSTYPAVKEEDHKPQTLESHEPITLPDEKLIEEKPTIKLPNSSEKGKASLLAIVIDDFGSYERGGVDELLNSNFNITCAIMPFVDYSKEDYDRAIGSNKEVILHMPMQAHVNLPESWYGPVYIGSYENPSTAVEKLQKCFDEFPNAKGFNIHIGSGASRNQKLMEAMYNYANKHNMFFLDSRTILDDKCEEACTSTKSIYLGRDVFLEPEKNRSYQGVTNRLNEAAAIAKEKGYAIAIGHVGAEGGINTARAILDFCKTLEDKNIELVPLSRVYELIKADQFT